MGADYKFITALFLCSLDVGKEKCRRPSIKEKHHLAA